MAPPSRTRRRILPSGALAAFGAAPLRPRVKIAGRGDVPSEVVPSAAAIGAHGRPSSKASTKTPAPTPSPRGASASSEQTITPNGIKIGPWTITTQNSTIGDEKCMEELTTLLEETANDPDHVNSRNASRRRLCPPEITFLDAIVSFRYKDVSKHLVESASDTVTEIRFTAQDALLEWAEAHKYLEVQQDQTQSRKDFSFRGVSILRTADAKIWSDKPRNVAVASSNSEFYYDWTFSSPYAGSVCYPGLDKSACAEKKDSVNNRGRWRPLPQSRIPFHLLQDTSQPILLYDDIHLYEDDLHDNGDVSLNVKVRVMPRCWYVLQRMFARVDRVRVRCREARYFCSFEDVGGGDDGVRAHTVYRDVVWREAAWKELGGLALPTDPAAWREEGNAGGAAPGIPPPPPLASLLTRLPVVTLPDDLPQFACVDVDEE